MNRDGRLTWNNRDDAEGGVTQEPTDGELEDAVVASMKRQAPGDTPDWPEWVWVRFARIALSAARAVGRDTR